MGNLGLIIGREYSQRIRSTSFKVTTAIGFVLIMALAFAPAILDRIESATSGSTVAVVGSNKDLAPALRSTLTEELPNGEPRTEIVAVDSAEATEGEIESGKYDGVLTPQSSSEASYVYRGQQPGAEAQRLREALGSITAQQRLRETGLSGKEAAGIFEPAALEVEATGEVASGEERLNSQFLVYALLFLLYFTVLLYGATVSGGIVQEKSSRITEVMAASVKPFDLMAGKILGIGLVGVTQYGFWITAGAISLIADSVRGDDSRVDLAAVPPTALLLFVLFFILGFLLYAALYAGLSSLVSRQEDSTQINMPIGFMIIGGFLLSMVTLAQPNGTLAVVGSYVPFFSPMVMFARAVLGSPPAWEVALSISVLVVSVLGALWFAAKLYRMGILLYGKRPSFAEVARIVQGRTR